MERSGEADRREFLRATAGVTAAAVAAGVMGGFGPDEQEGRAAGIRSLRLKAARGKVGEMRRFYSEVMGLGVVDLGDGIAVRAGATLITFEPVEQVSAAKPLTTGTGGGVSREQDTGLTQSRETRGTMVTRDTGPYYHFAFNIPENKLAAGKRWLAPRCPLIKRPDGSDEYHFVSWNAHSVYFLDPAGNILEFIARHNLKNAGEGEFASADILYASEIALVVDDVGAAADGAKDKLGMGVFAGSQSDQFAAVGDDHRLLIIVKRGRAWNSGHGRAAEVHPLKAEIVGAGGRFESGVHQFEVVAGA